MVTNDLTNTPGNKFSVKTTKYRGLYAKMRLIPFFSEFQRCYWADPIGGPLFPPPFFSFFSSFPSDGRRRGRRRRTEQRDGMVAHAGAVDTALGVPVAARCSDRGREGGAARVAARDAR